MQALGVVASGHHQCGGGVRPDTETIEEFGHRGHQQRFDPLVEFGELIVEATDPMRQRGSDALVAAVTVSVERAGRNFTPSATSAVTLSL